MSWKVCQRYPEESTPDVRGREYVHSAYEKQTPVFMQTATHTRDVGICRLSESVILIFTVRK